MDVLGILLEQLGFVASIVLLLFFVSIVTGLHPSSDVGVPQAIDNQYSSKKKL
jgi:hypothetical protein